MLHQSMYLIVSDDVMSQFYCTLQYLLIAALSESQCVSVQVLYQQLLRIKWALSQFISVKVLYQ